MRYTLLLVTGLQRTLVGWAQKARNSFLYMARARKKSASRNKAKKRRSKELDSEHTTKRGSTRKSARERPRQFDPEVKEVEALDASDASDAPNALKSTEAATSSRQSLTKAATKPSVSMSLDVDTDVFAPHPPVSPRALENTLYRIGSVDGDLTLVKISSDKQDARGGSGSSSGTVFNIDVWPSKICLLSLIFN